MTSNRHLLVGAFVLTVVLAACGGAASKTAAPTAAATQGGNGGNTPTVQPTEQGGIQPTQAPISLEPGNATELEKLIPSKVGTTEITKTSLDFSGIPWAAFGGSGVMEQILKDNGKTMADVKFAMGVSPTPDANGVMTIIYAMQIKGLDAAKFVEAIDGSYAENEELTIGGKKVHGTIAGGFGNITYLHDDVAFTALASETNLTEIVAALP